MSQPKIADTNIALSVHDAYKVFGKEKKQRIKWPWQNGNGHKNGNGKSHNGKGHKNSNGKGITTAVDHLTFDVKQGEIFGVLGPNGGGKSTLIRLIATLLLPDQGTITVFGHDVTREPLVAQQLLNRVSVEASFFEKLSPMENLLYGARLAGREVLLYLLLEHKSGPDPFTPLQVLRYVMGVWRRFCDENPHATRLPPVVAVVVHHQDAVRLVVFRSHGR